MSQKEKLATIIATGQKVYVYKSSLKNEWIEYPNCKLSHKTKDLQFD